MQVDIDANWTVNEVAARYPAAIGALEALGIDTCCGGWERLTEAAAAAGTDAATAIAAVRDAVTSHTTASSST